MTELVIFGPLDQDIIKAGADDIYGIEISYHAGVPTFPLVEGERVEETVYRIMRARHEFLTDDNHTWDFIPAEKPEWHNRLRVIKNEKSTRWVWKPSWMDDGPGAHWFTENWRIATRGIIAAEVASEYARARQLAAQAEAQRDTIRGRKARANYLSSAKSHESVALMIAKRWPQHLQRLAA